MKLTTRPPSGFTLFVNMLPFLEQQPLYNGWNFSLTRPWGPGPAAK